MFPDLISLKLFIQTAEQQSISKAATQCHIALAAASRRIKMLEHCYGVQLLHRSPKGVQLTAAGKSFLGHARGILYRESVLKAEMSDFLKGIKGYIRLQANTSAITQFLPKELATFSQNFPDVKIALSERRSHSIVHEIRDGKTDLGIVLDGQNWQDIIRFPYHQDTLVAVAPSEHARELQDLSFPELLRYDFVGLDSDTAIMRLLSSAATKANKVLRLRVQVSSFEAVCKFVQAGFGIGILPTMIAEEVAPSMGLTLLHLKEEWTKRDMFLCVSDIETLATPTKTLLSHLTGNTNLALSKPLPSTAPITKSRS
ncbi:MAG: LysR family transcriptional regulator [Planctomycetota bacterium]|nr:MAG: LysR family transcriptional regulator [Planctomycetota bacterium]